ncbi:MAG: hypothetical protein HN600_01320, partial [Bacteroidetes bacterium]|nr:hypothetical protein [Bacteroidota bacterium]
MYIFQKRQRTFFILFLVLLLNAYFIVACNDSGDSGGTGTSTGTTPTAEGKAISLFNFEASNNCELSSDVVGSINQNDHTISLTVPNGTVVTSLVAKFTTDGSNVKVSVDSQTSGTTANDFTGSVTYIVTAADSTTQDYIATVTISTPPSSGDGTLFVQEAYIKSLNAGMYDYTGSAVSISGDTIVVGVYGENSDATSITNGATAPSNSGGNDNGAVYVYKRTGFDW